LEYVYRVHKFLQSFLRVYSRYILVFFVINLCFYISQNMTYFKTKFWRTISMYIYSYLLFCWFFWRWKCVIFKIFNKRAHGVSQEHRLVFGYINFNGNTTPCSTDEFFIWYSECLLCLFTFVEKLHNVLWSNLFSIY
jgi:hypothetical protein